MYFPVLNLVREYAENILINNTPELNMNSHILHYKDTLDIITNTDLRY